MIPSPVVIGGLGGSGTRLTAALLREAGVDLGSWVNASGDALALVPLYDAYVDPFLAGAGFDLAGFRRELERALVRHREGMTSGRPWGWKNPRSLYLLPVFQQLWPDLVFIHVLRHGLDMALADNRNQLQRHGETLLGPWRGRLLPIVAQTLLWAKANTLAADWGESWGGPYFRLRYEDLCADPDAALAPVLAALGLRRPASGWRTPLNPVAARWPRLDRDLRNFLGERIGATLERFGYRWDGSAPRPRRTAGSHA